MAFEDRERACAKARAEALAEGEARGETRGEARQTALFAAMSESGLSADEIVAALSGGNLAELYRKYDIE